MKKIKIGSQSKLPVYEVTEEEKKDLRTFLAGIYRTIKSEFVNIRKFEDVLGGGGSYSSADLKSRQAPEEFAKKKIVEPLLDFLGYDCTPQIVLPTPGGIKKPDYKIQPKGGEKPILWVEAEPINEKLEDNKGHGVDQIKTWLLSKVSNTDYGIATNGFKWILVKFNQSTTKSDSIFEVDLTPIFQKIHNPHCFTEKSEIDETLKKFLFFNPHNFLIGTGQFFESIEEEKEQISKTFYNDYVRYVFGLDERGEKITGRCLLDSVIAPRDAEEHMRQLFAVIFMNRLIFIRFLEEKGVVPEDLLNKLYKNYQETRSLSTFYRTNLNPLFYDIFNKEKDKRRDNLKADPIYSQIPYLNGGLFREIILNEKTYDIEDEGIELILREIIEKYEFSIGSGDGSSLNPDILGYVFEKTINYISGTGTEAQRMAGAYYTPDDVVRFIIEKTVVPAIYEKIMDGLRKSDYREADLRSYKSIEDILTDPPKNPKVLRHILEEIDTIKILDPACGSGHFLTGVLAEILRVKEFLLNAMRKEIDRYELKKNLISNNIFGVDIDKNAVEIARLRLWLSLIEEVEVTDPQHISTLPNIDFNIISGNSLIGWLDEELKVNPLDDISKDEYVDKILKVLKPNYEIEINEITDSLKKREVKDVINAYKRFIGIYAPQSGTCAADIHRILEFMRGKIYDVVWKSYSYYISGNSNLSKKEWELIENTISERLPFHWQVDFGDVMGNGGFDVIIGNPPYIEDRNYSDTDRIILKSQKRGNHGSDEGSLFYNSWNCGNTHAYFIERSINLLKSGGHFGFIVPIALVSTDRMSAVREFVHNNSSKVYYYNFDDRPGKIFSGEEDCRSTIVFTEKNGGTNEINTSRYIRWVTKDRPTLFQKLDTTNWSIKEKGGVIPKIGEEIEKSIIDKMYKKANGKQIVDFIDPEGDEIWYHNAPRYWIHAHAEEYLPKAEYYNYEKINGVIRIGKLIKKGITDQYKSIRIKEKYSSIVLPLLNSNLFYWWYILWSDGRHLLDKHIKIFPIDLSLFPEELAKNLKSQVFELLEDYEKHTGVTSSERRQGYVLKYKEYKPRASKGIIDEIDRLFAQYYEFNEEELNFILNFDLEFRVS